MKRRFRTVWVSDLHLGTHGCRAEDLSRWLKRIECDRLYLVGDIIDMWRLRSRWHWPAEHNRVIRRLLKLAHRGTEILYIPGNHDDAARQFAGMEFGGIRIELTALHETADGRSLLVTHGDQYDLVIRHSPLLSRIGGIGYESLLRANRWWNRGRAAFGLPYHSLSRSIKLKVKQACTFISRFEENVAHEAERAGFDGVICGHIHKADARRLPGAELGEAGRDAVPTEADARESRVPVGVAREAATGIEYYNCGDWVESCTALVEHDCGRLEVIDALDWLDAREADEAVIEVDDLESWPEIPMPLPLPVPRSRRSVRLG